MTTHHNSSTQFTRLLISILVCALLISTPAASGQALSSAGYEKLLSDASAARQGDKKYDQVAEVLNIFRAGSQKLDPAEIVARIKESWPVAEKVDALFVPEEVRPRLVFEGKEYEQLKATVKPLLIYTGMEGRVRPLLFKSEMPVIMFVAPGSLLVSTRARELLDDKEVEALAAHELIHVIAQPVFRKAVDEHDDRTMRLVELFCDAGGAALVAGMGDDPRKLFSGLSKMSDVLQVEFQEYLRASKDPPLKARKQLNDALVKEFSAVAKSSVAGGR